METKAFYIRNTKTDKSFDTCELKFFPNNWEPELTDDKEWLEILMNNDPETFVDCVIEEVELN